MLRTHTEHMSRCIKATVWVQFGVPDPRTLHFAPFTKPSLTDTQITLTFSLSYSPALLVHPTPLLLSLQFLMYPRDHNAADRARLRRRSTSPSLSSASDGTEQQRTQSPSPSSPVAVNCCECGFCPPAPSPALGNDALQPRHCCCCWDIEPAARLSENSAPLCQRSDITSTIRDGVSTADFDYCCTRIKGSTPATFAACTPAQKRLMLYGALHRLLYGQGSRAQRRGIQCRSASSTWSGVSMRCQSKAVTLQSKCSHDAVRVWSKHSQIIVKT